MKRSTTNGTPAAPTATSMKRRADGAPAANAGEDPTRSMKRRAAATNGDEEGGSSIRDSTKAGSCKIVLVAPAPAPPPEYWKSAKANADTFEFVRTRHMRRKVEYLLNHCAEHKNGCSQQIGGCTPFRNVQVVEVNRIENHMLWRRFAAGQARSGQNSHSWAEQSRPIRRHVGGKDERFLFHGTSPIAVSNIAAEGFKIPVRHTLSRYGQGVYFTDQSCKAHQYSDKRFSRRQFTTHTDLSLTDVLVCACVSCRFVLQEDGSRLYCMLYCRVSTRKEHDFHVTDDVRKNRYLHGMVQPNPSDEIFRQRLPEEQQAFDSLVVVPGQKHQVHREFVVFDTAQAYPEYVVWYKLDESSVKVEGKLMETEGDGEIYLIVKQGEYCHVIPTKRRACPPALWLLLTVQRAGFWQRANGWVITRSKKRRNCQS